MLPTTEARKVLLDNESADAACAHRCICERENRIDLRQHAIGDEALRAVEDIFVATAHRYRLHSCRVRTGTRLGQAKGRQPLTTCQWRYILALLLLITREQNRG